MKFIELTQNVQYGFMTSFVDVSNITVFAKDINNEGTLILLINEEYITVKESYEEVEELIKEQIK